MLAWSSMDCSGASISLLPWSHSVRSDLPPPPCYLENQWSYRVPRGGVRKFSTSSFHSILNIVRSTLSFGSTSGQRSNFDVSVWWSLGPAILIAFALNSPKLTQSNIKGILKIPCEHKFHTKYGSGSSVEDRSQKVTKGHQIQKSFFGHAAHIF